MNYSGNQNLQNANAPLSNYAQAFGLDQNKILLNDIKKEIIDQTPNDYIDIKMLMLKDNYQSSNSDEHIWFESPNQNNPLRSTVLTANIAAGSTQTIPVSDTTVVGTDTMVFYDSNGAQAAVIAIDPVASTVTLRAMTNLSLPALSSGNSYVFANASRNVADSSLGTSSGSRISGLMEQYNYVELFMDDTKFGMVEKQKYLQNETINYVDFNRKKMIEKVMLSQSNKFWNGTRGQIVLSNNLPAKTMEGIYPWLIRNSAYQATTTPANLWTTIQDAGFSTRHGSGNYPRMIFGTPKWIQQIAANLKTDLIRYTAESDTNVSLNLETVSVGTAKYVLMPYQRFEAASGSFPSFFENTLFLLDWDFINPVKMKGIPDFMGQIGSLMTNQYTMALAEIEYQFASLSLQPTVADAHAVITVTP